MCKIDLNDAPLTQTTQTTDIEDWLKYIALPPSSPPKPPAPQSDDPTALLPLNLDSLFDCDDITSKEESDSQASQDVSDIDPKVLKRQRNTESARRSRQRKQERLENLEKKISEVQLERSTLKFKIASLESEKKIWQKREQEFGMCIKSLQTRLQQVHQMLTFVRKQE